MKKEIDQKLIQKLPQDLRSTESLLEYIEELENEIKRLNKVVGICLSVLGIITISIKVLVG